MSKPQPDRLPPHDIEAEQGILACILLSPEECAGICCEKDAVAEWMYDLRHQSIFGTMLEMYGDRAAIDMTTLHSKLKSKGLIEEVGGLDYIQTLPDMVPSAANLPSYLDIVRAKFFLQTAWKPYIVGYANF